MNRKPMETAAARVADTIRKVTAAIQRELEGGLRSSRIDAHDLVDILLALADELDPPLAEPMRES